MYPVQRALYIRKARLQPANPVGIRSASETDSIHHSREKNVGFRQDINIGSHPWGDTLELTFTEISNGPPDACIDEGEYLLTDVGVSTLGDGEIRDSGIEGRIHTAVIQVITRVLYCCLPCPPLVNEWFQRGYGVLSLLVLCQR